jgi:hypothetical protein
MYLNWSGISALSSRGSDDQKRCSPEFHAHVDGVQLLSGVLAILRVITLGQGQLLCALTERVVNYSASSIYGQTAY